MTKCMFIYNPISGKSKKIVKKLKYIENKLKEKYDQVDMIATEYAGHTVELAKFACNNYNALIFAGGDGTFSEVVKGVGERKNAPTLGFIPTGTVSDMANNYKIPRNIKKALDICLQGNRTKIDVCKLNDTFFAYVCGFGTYTSATFETSPRLKKKYGRMAYYVVGAKNAFKVKESKVQFTVNSKTFEEDTYLFLVLNTKSVGGFASFNYKNKLGDGKFDVIIVKKGAIKLPIDIWRLFVMGADKFADDPAFTIFSTDKINIKVDEEIEWNLDGDAYKAKEIEIECLKKRLNLFVPKE